MRDKQMRRGGSILEVRVHPDDLGKVIGRGGRRGRARDSRASLALAAPLHRAHGLQSGDNLAHRVGVRAIVKPYVTRRKFDFEDYWRRTYGDRTCCRGKIPMLSTSQLLG